MGNLKKRESLKQASYLKDETDFLNFIEKTKLPRSTILVSMDVTSLYNPRRRVLPLYEKQTENSMRKTLPFLPGI